MYNWKILHGMAGREVAFVNRIFGIPLFLHPMFRISIAVVNPRHIGLSLSNFIQMNSAQNNDR